MSNEDVIIELMQLRKENAQLKEVVRKYKQAEKDGLLAVFPSKCFSCLNNKTVSCVKNFSDQMNCLQKKQDYYKSAKVGE